MMSISKQKAKVAVGLLLGLIIGALCRSLGIPSPAPPVLTGALLVVSMTLGYTSTDRWLINKQKPKNRRLCGGPDGSIKKTT